MTQSPHQRASTEIKQVAPEQSIHSASADGGPQTFPEVSMRLGQGCRPAPGGELADSSLPTPQRMLGGVVTKRSSIVGSWWCWQSSCTLHTSYAGSGCWWLSALAAVTAKGQACRALLGPQGVLAGCALDDYAAPPWQILSKISRMCCYAGPWRQVSAAHLQVLQALQVSTCHCPKCTVRCEACTCQQHVSSRTMQHARLFRDSTG